MHAENEVDTLSRLLDSKKQVTGPRVERYRGRNRLRYTADTVESADLATFRTNLYRVAVDSVAERMRLRGVNVTAAGTDVSKIAWNEWLASDMDQHAPTLIREALAAGAGFCTIVTTPSGRSRVVVEDAESMVTQFDPITRDPVKSLRRWDDLHPDGTIRTEFATVYDAAEVRTYEKRSGWTLIERVPHTLGQCPVVTVTNRRALSGSYGYSVIDDMTPLVDGLSKVLSDMLVASEDVARPRRWASGIDLEEQDDDDGFVADAGVGIDMDGHLADDRDGPTPVESPFEHGNRMFTTESAEAKFGQLPGADLAGYRTAAELLRQEIMTVASLPAHLVGVTTANPASADATRASELSLTAAAESAMSVVGPSLERAFRLLVSARTGFRPDDVTVRLRWCRPDTRSEAQDVDGVTKLFALGLLSVEEARARIRVDDYA